MSTNRTNRILLAAALVAVLCGLGGCFLFEATGTVIGTVYDSTTGGTGLAGVSVTVLGTSHSTTTDVGGEFELQAPAGLVTLRCQKSGYTITDVDVEVVQGSDSATNVDIVAYRPLGAGEYRFVLTWGAQPDDLDSHLFLPIDEDVYFGNPIASDGSAYLDWDDTDSYGPETITIETVGSGTYTYYIENYSEDPDMGPTSAAVVRVYGSTGLIKTLSINDAPGASTSSDLYWEVFTFDGAMFTWVNELVSSIF
jgi:hypothetical protein